MRKDRKGEHEAYKYTLIRKIRGEKKKKARTYIEDRYEIMRRSIMHDRADIIVTEDIFRMWALAKFRIKHQTLYFSVIS